MRLIFPALVVGFTGFFYPYSRLSMLHVHKGSFPDLFKTYSRLNNYQETEFRFYNRSCSDVLCLDLLDGAVTSQEAFTLLNLAILKKEYPELYRLAPHAVKAKMAWYERAPDVAPVYSSLDTFLVYRTWPQLAGLAAWGGLHLYGMIQPRPIRPDSPPIGLQILVFTTDGVNTIGSALLLGGWNGGFLGAKLNQPTVSPEKMENVVVEIFEGRRKLATEDGFFRPDEETVMFGSNNSFYICQDAFDCLNKACQDPSVVAQVFDNDYLQHKVIGGCNLREIVSLHNKSTPFPWLSDLLRLGNSYGFPISKSLPKKNYEKFVFLLLSYYQSDLMLAAALRGLSSREFVRTMRAMDKNKDDGLTPISLSHLEIPFYIFMGFIIGCCAVLCYEFKHFRAHKTNNRGADAKPVPPRTLLALIIPPV